ncbi:MAG TPA: hypothetical protein VKG78_12865 [Opitutaceae bacterium]|nr:hypothetical protein [Opitutaceae bacterium]
MSSSQETRKTPPSAPALVFAGAVIAVVAWLLPVSLKSISKGLLGSAGEGTPSVAAFGRELVDSEKVGPAMFLLDVSKAVKDPQTPALQRAVDAFSSRQPALVAWGGWDPSLDPLFNLRQRSPFGPSTPVLTFLIPEKARDVVRAYLANSGSLGVQAILKTRDVAVTGRFVPANRPGGQPLDALILLAGLLYQGEHLSPTLQREVRALAEAAAARGELGELEGFYMDLLSLGRRLDWTQLGELLRRTENVRTVGEYAHLSRVAPDQLPFIYSAALLSNSADRVAYYLIRYGIAGSEDLRLALADGQGAVDLLLQRAVPVNRSPGPAMGAASALVLVHPRLMLALKYAGYILGLFLLLRGLDIWVVSPAGGPSAGPQQHVRAGMLAVVMSALFIVATEPFLLKAAPPSEYRLRLALPMLANTATPPPSAPTSTPVIMETSTLVSIGVFAALQVGMYMACLRKIQEIERQDCPPLLKLRLMENEENLFDSGLYVGMMGTAAALVLQVLGVIEPNLLAAYSSNLFGIICVALVKIRHVRGYRRRLIMEGQRASAAPAAP